MTCYSAILLFLALLAVTPAHPQTSNPPAQSTTTARALLIGIDHYAPASGYPPGTPGWITAIPELRGCRNDALSIRSQLIARFGFTPGNIQTLFDQTATRDAILKGITNLLEASHPGDVACFYYAGHGTQVHNRFSAEEDKLDECIVPADTWRPNIRDIRDKELARLFNAFIDKRVILTFIVDCCHSGSLSRGLDFSDNRYRYAPQPDYDAADSSRPPAPESRPGNYFLAFSATQSDEKAGETCDESGVPHGLFTLALEQAWNTLPPNIPARELCNSVRAILAASGFSQQPSLATSSARSNQTLFGQPAAGRRAAIAVEAVQGGIVTLQGGLALQLAKGNRLAAFGKTTADTVALLQIDTVLGISTCQAHVLKTTASILAGQQFFITNWVSTGQPLLKVYIPHTRLTARQVDSICRILAAVRHSRKASWLNNRFHSDPYACLVFDGDKARWKTGNQPPEWLKTISAQAILQRCPPDSTLYVEIPVSSDQADAFIKAIGKTGTVQLVEDPTQANYQLYGQLDPDDHPAYGLRKIQIAARDSLTDLPPITDAVNDPDSLAGFAMKLAKLRGWLFVITPPGGGSTIFPYHLEIFNETTGKVYRSNSYRINDVVGFKLVRDSLPQGPGIRMFVYVFTVDAGGSMHLVSSPNDDDALLEPIDGFGKPLVEKPIASDDTIAAPVGVDHYFVLATREALPSPGIIFNQEGVYTSVTRSIYGSGPINPLLRLIDMGNSQSKGAGSFSVNTTWVLQQRSFICNW